MFFLYVYLGIKCVQYPQKPKEGARSSGTSVTDGMEYLKNYNKHMVIESVY